MSLDEIADDMINLTSMFFIAVTSRNQNINSAEFIRTVKCYSVLIRG